MEYINCSYCSNSFKPYRKDKRIKYCSKKCREYDWVQNNKERDSELKAKSRNKKTRTCKKCLKDIPKKLNGTGTQFCSVKCKKESIKVSQKQYQIQAFAAFNKYKLSKGCKICGYKKYVGSLDFHHIDPTVKERRITAKMFYSNSIKIQEELSKCILVCKNCHYELHHLYNVDPEEYKRLTFV